VNHPPKWIVMPLNLRHVLLNDRPSPRHRVVEARDQTRQAEGASKELNSVAGQFIASALAVSFLE
jgi:hypothetical protein